MANANEERKEVRFWGALKMLAVLILVVFTHNRLPTTLIEVGSFSRVEIKKKKQRKQQLFQWPNNPPEMPHWPPPPIPTTMRAITTVTASTTWSYAPFASTQSSRTGPEPWFGLAAGIGSIWQPVAVLPWCPILGLFTHGPYEVWGLPSHGYGPTFSHQWNLLPPPSNAPAQGLPASLHYGNWGTFSPTSENSSRANPTVPSMMGLSWVASGGVPSLQSVTQPVVLDHGSGAFGPLPSSIGSPVVYTASPPAQPADFYMVPPSGSGLLGQIPRQAVPSPVIHNRMLGLDRRIISQYITNSRDPVWWVAD
eukprot:XP_019075627.1 PREDICTED: proline-rich protein 36 isoform X2 [Vitis vinifera]